MGERNDGLSLDTNGTPLDTSGQNRLLIGLEPRTVWSEFFKLTQIPRESGNEHQVQQHLIEIAKSNNLNFMQDSAGNVVIYVPGKGRGTFAAPLILQSHTDMVCVASAEIIHDFKNEGISLIVEDREIDGENKKVLAAKETTLGADNGIGVAMLLAAALDDEIDDHPPLELLFTVEEETGLTGAKELNPSMLSGRNLVNLDTEEAGCIYISSAGGRDFICTIPVTRVSPSDNLVPFKICLTGLPGGHSGAEIHENRGNSIKFLGEILGELSIYGVELASFDGGNRRNVIPSIAEAVIWAPKNLDLSNRLEDAKNKIVSKYSLSFNLVQQELNSSNADQPLSDKSALELLSSVNLIPTGVISWSEAIDGLVETSNNLATISTSDDSITLCCMTRSSKDGEIEQVQESMARTGIPSNSTVMFENHSPGWEADINNPLLEAAKNSFRKLNGFDPAILAIHAGLECGAFSQHIPGIKMISFGPDIRGAHTTRECVVIETVETTWNCLKDLLENLC